jgi:hypothetical protein
MRFDALLSERAGERRMEGNFRQPSAADKDYR